MPLSCSCDYPDICEWYYTDPDDYTVMSGTGRRKRCSSCGELIALGSITARFRRWRNPRSDIEESIYSDEVPLASMYLCERCADLYFSFVELGFECVGPWENMLELAHEYAEEYVPTPKENKS